MFLLTIIYDKNTRNDLYKIYYNIQRKSIYTKELMKLKKIEKEIEKEQQDLWDE